MAENIFDKEKAFRLIAVTDLEGRDKVRSKKFYGERINCIATRLRYDDNPVHGSTDEYRMRMDFVRNETGMPIKRSLHTSVVHNVEKTGNGLKIHTNNSIYVLEEAELKKIVLLDETDLIEMYMSLEDDYYFGYGFYYDENTKPHELKEYVHLGMFQDSVIIHVTDHCISPETVCNYFPVWGCVEFYDVLRKKQPILIHNTGKSDLQIKFSSYEKVWTIKSGESKRIVPFFPNGADPEN